MRFRLLRQLISMLLVVTTLAWHQSPPSGATGFCHTATDFEERVSSSPDSRWGLIQRTYTARSGPGIKCNRIGRYEAGQSIEILREVGEWRQVLDWRGAGWVNAAAFRARASDRTGPCYERHDFEQGVPESPEPDIWLIVATYSARSGPGTRCNKIGTYRKGESVELLANVGNWYQVRDNRGVGWVYRSALAKLGDPPQVPADPPVFLDGTEDGIDASPALFTFTIDQHPERGVVRINSFIPDPLLEILPGVFGVGDNRQFDRRSTAKRSRSAIELDWRSGTGRFFMNYSCTTAATLTKCIDAAPIQFSEDQSRPPTQRRTNRLLVSRSVAEGIEKYLIQLSIGDPFQAAAVPFADFPFRAEANFVLMFPTGGGGRAIVLQLPGTTKFPSFESYQYLPGAEQRTLFEVQQTGPWPCMNSILCSKG